MGKWWNHVGCTKSCQDTMGIYLTIRWGYTVIRWGGDITRPPPHFLRNNHWKKLWWFIPVAVVFTNLTNHNWGMVNIVDPTLQPGFEFPVCTPDLTLFELDVATWSRSFFGVNLGYGSIPTITVIVVIYIYIHIIHVEIYIYKHIRSYQLENYCE